MKARNEVKTPEPKKIIRDYKTLIFSNRQFEHPEYLDWSGSSGEINWCSKSTDIEKGICTSKDLAHRGLQIKTIDDVLSLVGEFGWRVVGIYTIVKSDIQGYSTKMVVPETKKIVYTIEREIEK